MGIVVAVRHADRDVFRLMDPGMAQNIANANPPGPPPYSAPMTMKLLFTNTWCGQLTAIMWTS